MWRQIRCHCSDTLNTTNKACKKTQNIIGVCSILNWQDRGDTIKSWFLHVAYTASKSQIRNRSSCHKHNRKFWLIASPLVLQNATSATLADLVISVMTLLEESLSNTGSYCSFTLIRWTLCVLTSVTKGGSHSPLPKRKRMYGDKSVTS